MAKYSKKTQETVEDTMHEMKRGNLKRGKGGKVKSRKQAIAIGLSEARKKGYKALSEKSSKKTAKKTAAKKSSSVAKKKTMAKKKASATSKA